MRAWALVVLAALGACDCAVIFPGRGAVVGSPDDRAPTAPRDSIADWSRHFAAEGAVGAFVLYDAAARVTTRHDPHRAAERFPPASTSKVYNGLVFLDQGVVADVDSLHAWDGVERFAPSWNRDHSLRTATEASALWVFRRLAREVGRDGYAEAFAREPWGNRTLSDSLEWSWLDGTWRVSADEQVVFLDGLRRGALAFDAEHQRLAREMLPTLATADLRFAEAGGARLRGKTGWALATARDLEIGWLVGWVERPGGDAVFAMNAHAAPGARFDVRGGRLRIVRAVLADAGVFPGEGGVRP